MLKYTCPYVISISKCSHLFSHPNHTCEAAVASEGTETGQDDAAAALPQLATVLESPFASESSQDKPSKPKRGRPKGSSNKSKTANASEAEPAKALAPAAVGSKAKPERKKRGKNTQADDAQEAELAADLEAAGEAAGANDKAEAEGAAGAAARLEMARKASTGDGSRLERPPAVDSEDTGLSSVQAANHPHPHPQPGSPQAGPRQDAGLVNEGAAMLNGSRVFNPVSTATKPPHRLSKVTGNTAAVHCPPHTQVYMFRSHSSVGFILQCLDHT